MKRRNFISSLAGIPILGKLVTSSPDLPVLPKGAVKRPGYFKGQPVFWDDIVGTATSDSTEQTINGTAQYFVWVKLP